MTHFHYLGLAYVLPNWIWQPAMLSAVKGVLKAPRFDISVFHLSLSLDKGKERMISLGRAWAMFCSLLPWKWAVEGLCVVAGNPNYLRVRQAVRVVPVTVGPVEKAHTLLQQLPFLCGLGLYAFVLSWCLPFVYFGGVYWTSVVMGWRLQTDKKWKLIGVSCRFWSVWRFQEYVSSGASLEVARWTDGLPEVLNGEAFRLEIEPCLVFTSAELSNTQI